MKKWDGFKKKLRKFAIGHNLALKENYHEADAWVLDFRCSENSRGHFFISFELKENQLVVLAKLAKYDFESGIVKEKCSFKNIKKPDPFDEEKFLAFLKDLILEMMNFKGDDFDSIQKIKTPSNPFRWEIDSAPIEAHKRSLKNLPFPWFE